MATGSRSSIRCSFFLLITILPLIVIIQGYYLWIVANIHRQHRHVSAESFPQQLSGPRVLHGECFVVIGGTI